MKAYEKKFFRLADKIFFITTEDKQFAINNWKIPAEKCIAVPFGIELSNFPADRSLHQQQIKKLHNISGEEKILLFNGLLNYKPNLDALLAIVEKINPLLLSSSLKYKIIICGKNLPAEWNELKSYTDKNILYAGFVPMIEEYFRAADLFLNPVFSGGGIKTKMVEAIANGTTVISTKSGAAGMTKEVCGEKLLIVNDGDWAAFAKNIEASAGLQQPTPDSFYNEFYWGRIIERIIPALNH
ncbi:MAG: hypothetical protein C4308_11945 [Chitinophagaceae bacterium]